MPDRPKHNFLSLIRKARAACTDAYEKAQTGDDGKTQAIVLMMEARDKATDAIVELRLSMGKKTAS